MNFSWVLLLFHSLWIYRIQLDFFQVILLRYFLSFWLFFNYILEGRKASGAFHIHIYGIYDDEWDLYGLLVLWAPIFPDAEIENKAWQVVELEGAKDSISQENRQLLGNILTLQSRINDLEMSLGSAQSSMDAQKVQSFYLISLIPLMGLVP